MKNLSVKNVPEIMIVRLRERAKRHHRSLQGELLSILEETIAPHRISVRELHKEIQKLGLRTPSESVSIIREDRDAR